MVVSIIHTCAKSYPCLCIKLRVNIDNVLISFVCCWTQIMSSMVYAQIRYCSNGPIAALSPFIVHRKTHSVVYCTHRQSSMCTNVSNKYNYICSWVDLLNVAVFFNVLLKKNNQEKLWLLSDIFMFFIAYSFPYTYTVWITGNIWEKCM